MPIRHLMAGAMLMLATGMLLSCAPATQARKLPEAGPEASYEDKALIILSTMDTANFNEISKLAKEHGVTSIEFSPTALIVEDMNPRLERALQRHPAVVFLKKDIVDTNELTALLGIEAGDAAVHWNHNYMGVPVTVPNPSEHSPPERLP